MARGFHLIFSLPAILIAFSGCATPSQPNAESQKEVVVSRIDGLSERPSWLKESEPLRFENGYAIALGVATIPGDNRVEAGYRIAENNAKAGIANSISQKLEFIFQQAQEGTGIDTDSSRFIGAESSKLLTSAVRSDKRYFEKVATTMDNGERVTQYRIFATVKMAESDFKKAVIEALEAAKGKKGMSDEFKEQVNKHWESFTSGDQVK